MKNVILATLLLVAALGTSAQINYKPHTIKVTGSAEKLIEPDIVHLIIQLKEVRNRNASIPLTQVRNEFMKACQSVRIASEDIQLSSVNSRLIQKLSLWRQKRTEVRQREVYDVKFTDMSKLLSLIEKLDKPYVESLHFGEQTHSEIDRFKKEVKENATQNGIEKANYLAHVAKGEIGKVIFIEEIIDTQSGGESDTYANRIRYKKESYGGGAKVNFGFKHITLHYKVQVVCALK